MHLHIPPLRSSGAHLSPASPKAATTRVCLFFGGSFHLRCGCGYAALRRAALGRRTDESIEGAALPETRSCCYKNLAQKKGCKEERGGSRVNKVSSMRKERAENTTERIKSIPQGSRSSRRGICKHDRDMGQNN